MPYALHAPYIDQNWPQHSTARGEAGRGGAVCRRVSHQMLMALSKLSICATVLVLMLFLVVVVVLVRLVVAVLAVW